MYIATFYSFKGGVGRTMGLVNVAIELAQLGRRVLIVDFDLEAPGLDTLDLPRPPGEHAGIVDYVTDYLATGESPDVSQYVYEAHGVGKRNGRLYIMPAGRREHGYAQRFNQIDWADLYAHHDGYLMFEDLKAQWQEYLAPDYVLIDSRTGHTDVSGICTRHLPDAVLIFFIPNQQNLRGLEKVVPDIREEATSGRGKSIDLLFVMSNVPDLDDEEDIIAARRKEFAKALGIDVRTRLEIIHRYDSLHLLNQAIFTKDKPRSRLAREYQQLTRRLMSMNPEDKEGALAFLRQLRNTRRQIEPADLERRINAIYQRHATDGVVLYELSLFRQEQGRLAEAAQLLDEAVQHGPAPSDVYLERAELHQRLGSPEGIAEDALRLLQDATADVYAIDRAVRLLRAIDHRAMAGVGRLPALASQSPSMRTWLGTQLRQSQAELQAGVALLSSVIDDPRVTEDDLRAARTELAFNYIGLGDCIAALQLIDLNAAAYAEPSTADLFNQAMARWGVDREPTVELFARVTAREHVLDAQPAVPNHLQCFAVARWAIGEPEAATVLVHRARNAAMLTRGEQVTCWRYMSVPIEAFLHDLDELISMIAGGDHVPPVVGTAFGRLPSRTT